MSDYRDPNDPLMRNFGYEPYSGSGKYGWAWIAAAVGLVIVLAIAFGVGHEPDRVASNDTAAPAAHVSPLTPPANMAAPPRPLSPGLAPPPAPVAPPATGQ
jgi:hypothetical protein